MLLSLLLSIAFYQYKQSIYEKTALYLNNHNDYNSIATLTNKQLLYLLLDSYSSHLTHPILLVCSHIKSNHH
jgi:hypothetical protein